MNQYIIHIIKTEGVMLGPHDYKFIVEAKSIEEAKQQIPVKWRASYVIGEYENG